MCDRAEFFGKNPHRAKITKNGQKWPQNRVFGLFKKIMLLVLSGICVKRKFLWFIDILWKLPTSKKWLSANGILVFFNRQYFTDTLISDFDFLHVERHEWKKQGSLTGFLKKVIIWENGPFRAQKLRILITLDPLEWFFKNFAKWKGLIGRWEWY